MASRRRRLPSQYAPATGAGITAPSTPGGSEAGALAVPWALLAIVILVGTGVDALAGLYPARLAGGLPIVRSLKHFE